MCCQAKSASICNCKYQKAGCRCLSNPKGIYTLQLITVKLLLRYKVIQFCKIGGVCDKNIKIIQYIVKIKRSIFVEWRRGTDGRKEILAKQTHMEGYTKI